MRTVVTLFVTAFFTLWSAFVVIAAKLFHAPVRAGSVYERQMMRWASVLIRTAGADVVLHGEENLTSGGGVYICNHVSWFDVFAIASQLPRCTFVAKHELRRIPVFGWGAEAAGVVFLDRENRKSAFASYEVAAQTVKQGRRIVVFPEGTRGLDYHLRQFKKGPFVLAISSEEPLIPTVIYGAREVMGKGSFRIRRGTVHIHYLPPVLTKGKTYDDRHEIMEATRQEMAELLEREYGVKSPSPAGVN